MSETSERRTAEIVKANLARVRLVAVAGVLLTDDRQCGRVLRGSAGGVQRGP